MLGMILKPLAEKLKIWFNLLDFGESLDLSGHLLSLGQLKCLKKQVSSHENGFQRLLVL